MLSWRVGDKTSGRGKLFRFLLPVIFLLLPAAVLLAAKLADCPHPLAEKDFSCRIYDRDGRLLRLSLTGDQKYRIRVRLSEIPPRALDAVIDYEDRWFWHHPGVNPFSMLRALASMLAGGRRLGGSTLTMQVARLSDGLKTDSPAGKLKQIWRAFCLERHYSKEEILEAYFNLAPYGGNVEGIASAARVYFHKDVSQLTEAESEALMLVPQNPVARRPSPGNRRFFDAVRRQWHGNGEYAPLRVFTPAELPFEAPHAAMELLAEMQRAGDEERHATIDARFQQKIETALSRFVARNGAYGLKNAAALLLHWPTMELRALAGSVSFANVGISGQVDGTRARRSPGSTLKPFIYALALEQGLIHPMTLLSDTPRSFSGYDPENFDHTFRGPIAAARALRASRNVPALSLAARLKNPSLYDFLRRAGVEFSSSEAHYGLSLVLGGAEVTLRELAGLYAMLANGGVWRPMRLAREDPDERVIRLLSREAAFVTLSMLEDEGPERQARSRSGANIPLRLKTGTSNGFRDAWTCGIVGPYVLAVWVGNFDNASNPLLVGGQTAAPLFVEMARSIAASEPMDDYFASPGAGVNVERIPVCAATGDVDVSLCGEHVETWFIPGVSPVKPSGVFRVIHVDRKSGLRACMPEAGRTERVVWEFWPSDLAALFAAAGLPKAPPPPFEAACGGEAAIGSPPRIRQPKHGLTYHASLASGGQTSLVLMAHAEAGVHTLRWFADGKHVGDTQPGQAMSWRTGAGIHHLLVTDDEGRTSARTVTVESVP